MHKPVLVKAYISVFVCLAVKAVHLKLVSDLTSKAFIGALRRFISRRGKPLLIWSDNGTNFVGAANELKTLFAFLQAEESEQGIVDFCSAQSITWKFIPEHAPHFGGLWEAAVKSAKLHLRKVVGENKLTFEEYSTVLTQVEACLNSHPLCSLPDSDDGIEALMPGLSSSVVRWKLCLTLLSCTNPAHCCIAGGFAKHWSDSSGNVGLLSTLLSSGSTPSGIARIVICKLVTLSVYAMKDPFPRSGRWGVLSQSILAEITWSA